MILSNSSLVQLSAPSTKKTKLSCIETEMGAADKFGSAVEEHAGPLTEDHNECYQLHRHNQTSLELLQSSQANPYTQGEKKGHILHPKYNHVFSNYCRITVDSLCIAVPYSLRRHSIIFSIIICLDKWGIISSSTAQIPVFPLLPLLFGLLLVLFVFVFGMMLHVDVT